eukprot:855121-Prymnesium_polylepis.1
MGRCGTQFGSHGTPHRTPAGLRPATARESRMQVRMHRWVGPVIGKGCMPPTRTESIETTNPWVRPRQQGWPQPPPPAVKRI